MEENIVLPQIFLFVCNYYLYYYIWVHILDIFNMKPVGKTINYYYTQFKHWTDCYCTWTSYPGDAFPKDPGLIFMPLNVPAIKTWVEKSHTTYLGFTAHKNMLTFILWLYNECVTIS